MASSSRSELNFDISDPFLGKPAKCYDNYYLYDNIPALPPLRVDIPPRSRSVDVDENRRFLTPSPPSAIVLLRPKLSSSPRLDPPARDLLFPLRLFELVPGASTLPAAAVEPQANEAASVPPPTTSTTTEAAPQPHQLQHAPRSRPRPTAYENEEDEGDGEASQSAHESEDDDEDRQPALRQSMGYENEPTGQATSYENEEDTDDGATGYENQGAGVWIGNRTALGSNNTALRNNDSSGRARAGQHLVTMPADNENSDDDDYDSEENSYPSDDDENSDENNAIFTSYPQAGSQQSFSGSYPDDSDMPSLTQSGPGTPIAKILTRQSTGNVLGRMPDKEQFDLLMPIACDIVAALDPLRQTRFSILLSKISSGRPSSMSTRLFRFALHRVGNARPLRAQQPVGLVKSATAALESRALETNRPHSAFDSQSLSDLGEFPQARSISSPDALDLRSASTASPFPYRTHSILTPSEPSHTDPPKRACSVEISRPPPSSPRKLRDRVFGSMSMSSRPQQWFSSSTAWNAEYQSLLDSASSAEKYHRLATLGKDFIQSAQMYGRVILSELHLPPSQKTIKPVSIGGVAGGEKFLIKSILFKLARDVAIPSRKDLWMYGGREPNHEQAIKAAGQELKGATQYHNCGIRGLRTPLMALITFNGHRLIAQSLVPIGKETLQYGSCNGGKEVLAANPELNQLMQMAGKKLCLATHLVKNFADQTTVEICGPGDIEAHKGTDGKFYVIDFGRIMPPAYRESVLREEDKLVRVVWSKKLRPELLRTWTGGPLNSDAFTPWGIHDPKFHHQNQLVAEATRYLEDVVVERFAHGQCSKHSRFLGLPIGQFLGKMHSLGINYRYLGKIRDRARQLLREDLSDALLHEMIARTMKVELRNLFRQRAEQDSFSSEEQARRVALDYLNLSFAGSNESDRYWKSTFRLALVQKFPKGLSESELKPYHRLRDALNIPTIVLRLCALSGLSLAPTALECINTAMKECQEEKKAVYFQFFSCDLVDIAPTVKHMSFIDFCQGMHYVKEMDESSSSSSSSSPSSLSSSSLLSSSSSSSSSAATGARDRLFSYAHDMFLSALSRAPDDIYSLFELGRLLFNHSSSKTGSQKRGLVKRAFEFLDACLNYDPPPEVREYYALALVSDSHERLVELINNGSVIPPSFFRNAHKAGRQLQISLEELQARSCEQLDSWLDRPPICLSSRSLFLILLEAAKHSGKLLDAISQKIASLLRLTLAEPFIESSPLTSLFDDLNFGPALSRLSSLSELSLANTSIGLATYANIASYCPHLTHLDVSGCTLDATSLTRILNASSKLKHLSVAKPGATIDTCVRDALFSSAPNSRLTSLVLPTAFVQQYMNELSESFPNCNFRLLFPSGWSGQKLSRSTDGGRLLTSSEELNIRVSGGGGGMQPNFLRMSDLGPRSPSGPTSPRSPRTATQVSPRSSLSSSNSP